MIVRYKKQFLKDIEKLPDTGLQNEVAAVIRAVKAAETFSDIANVKKLKGYKTAYRIRVGDFRIGLVVVDNAAEFVRVANRKDIYKLFP